MRIRGRWFGLSVLLAIGGLLSSAAGCGDLCAQTGVGCQGKGGAGGETVCPAEEVPPAEPPKAEDQFPEDGRHYITKNPAGTCGHVFNPDDPMGEPLWEGSPLFASLAAPPGGPTPILSTFCAYLWNGPVAPADALALSMLPGAPAPDPRKVEPQGAVQDWAQNAFMGALHLPPMDSPSTGLHVRVIVADTEARTVPVDATELQLGSNMHGSLMRELIDDVACPPEPEPCSVQVETRLAMPLIRRDGLDTLVLNGGDFGRLGDLAAVIDDALVDWRTQLEAGTAPERLVLNLSLGFEREGAQETAADDAVKQALRAFACHGGAIFAAAGNHRGPNSHGLILPGGWQTEPEPTPEECSALLGSGYEDLDAMYKAKTGNPLLRPYDKGTAFLLSAVGAVDKGGRPITKTREAWPVDPSEHDSECPRLVAHGLGWSKGDAEFLLTGTSDAAAVVSAVFAKAMAQSTFHGLDTPYLTAHPQTLRDALRVESASADFDGDGPCGVPWSCGPTPWIAGLESPQGDAPANEAAQFPWQDYLPSGTSATPHSTAVHPCSQWRPVCEREMASPPALVFAQPGNLPCAGGGCVLQLPDNNDIEHIAIFYIDPAMAMTSAKLTIDGIDGSRTILDLDPNVALSSDANAEAPRFEIGDVTIRRSDRVSFSAFNLGNQVAFSDQVLLVEPQQQ